MNKTREDMEKELENREPTVSINLYKIETGDKDIGALALSLDFGENGPPKSAEEADLAQTIAIILCKKFTELMEELQGVKVTNNSEEVLSSLLTKQKNETSKVRDEIDKQLEDMGITPTQQNKEVH